MLEIGRERGFPTLAEDAGVLELQDEYTAILVDHLDGVADAQEDPRDFVQAVAHSLGLDPGNADDAAPCTKLALAHLFGEFC